ncbi:NADH-quinone oxidoreductase subunit L [Candidatus Bandiella numerosa]|uniref:NADH-quinone oxidoreductase subunit L n=1 Tax=Candidatus Bandiella numerosa TaxID=2570586 RepID=UPI00249E683A|nr:NADH-quinone oxidoreductase subunit L [Candidatus Bandiella numerosa]WHA04702.1 NADH-quinone oxidoreductase subunit L [Candidatus Bandiella numerosa]
MFTIEHLAIYTLFLPIVASIVVGLGTRALSAKMSQIITITAILVSTVFSVVIFNYVALNHNIIHIKLMKWVDISFFQASWSIYIDSVTAVMLLVVNLVSLLVHVYSVGYMSHDMHRQRFMAYLSLFTFFMLILVTSDNLLQLFVGWEGVGLSSFLLIGFWFEKQSAANAAIKAFLVNRVGDIGLALSIILIAITFKTIEYQQIFANLDRIYDSYFSLFGIEFSTIDTICILMFIGCMGKSAQLGLHTWLPDAMEGPTPVSALIHAATMVTAGVFLLVRCSFMFEHSQIALNIITIIGALTCLFAASIAIVQNDIKKIIAYSTCSQLGYMFFACGVSAYSVAIFHLMTHAFFKALLFLGAGSVIHAINNEQDIRKMGGLYKLLPRSYTLMWIGSLALAGIYPFAGYFSKDLILENAYLAQTKLGYFAFLIGIIAAFLTALYSWRLIILVFHKESKLKEKVVKNIHEAPISMMIPMIVLAIGAIFSGYIGEYILEMANASSSFWSGAVAIAMKHESGIHILPIFIKYIPLIIGIIGIMTAYLLYFNNKNLPNYISGKLKLIYRILLNKYYFDEIYNFLFVISIKKISNLFWKIVDNSIIDGIPNSMARLVYNFSRVSRRLQTGMIYHYSFFMFIGILTIICFVIFS